MALAILNTVFSGVAFLIEVHSNKKESAYYCVYILVLLLLRGGGARHRPKAGLYVI